MGSIETIMKNWKRFTTENPDIKDAINDGYEVAAYDEETQMIIAVELVGKDLKVRIVEDSHIIRKSA